MNGKKSSLLISALIVILLIFVVWAIVYIMNQTQHKPVVSPLNFSNIQKSTLQKEEQSFIVLQMDVENVSGQTVKNFTAVVTVYTPQNDSVDYTVIYLDPVPADSTVRITKTFEYNSTDPLQREVFQTPSQELRFKVRVTEYEQ